MLSLTISRNVGKNFLRILFFFLLITQICFGQQDFWGQTNGPGGGNAMPPVAINSQGDMFAAFGQGRLFRSTDDGISWKPSQNGLATNTDLRSVVINKNGYLFTGSYGEGMYRSTNNGQSWTSLPTSSAYTLELTTDRNGDILQGTFWDGIYKSTDDGETWMFLNSGLGWVSALTVDDSGRIYAGQGEYTGGGIYVSTNNGQTWSSLGLSGQWIMSICFTANGDIFVSSLHSGVYRSQNQGLTWTLVNSGLPTLPDYYDLSVDSLDRLYFCHDFGLFRSSDYGSSWSQLNNYKLGRFVWFDNQETIFENTDGYGILLSTDDGATWYQHGPALSKASSLCTLSGGILLAGSDPESSLEENTGIYRSTDGGMSWISTTLLNKYIYSISSLNNELVFAGTTNGIYKSTDYGIDWSFLGLANTNVNSILFTWDSKLLAATSNGIYFSADSGYSWSFFGMLGTNVLSAATTGSDYILAGTDGQGIYLSSDNGISWVFAGLPNLSVRTILIDESENILAGTSGGVYSSTNMGFSWTYRGLVDENLQTLYKHSSGLIFAGTANNGTYSSSDQGMTWSQINSGLKNTNVLCFASDTESYLYAGTDGNGVFKSTQPITGLEDIDNNLPTEFSLSQNYPNPFNSSSTIKYSIPKSSQVTLKIFNTLGEELETLVNEEKPVGAYELNWNAANLPSGVYFYQLKAGEFLSVKKMILLK